MSSIALSRRLAAEALGTALLLAVVVGSGIMGERLAGGNVAIALLANSLATGAGLYALITVLGPLSGAHFNPAVTGVAWLSRQIAGRDALAYGVVQVAGAVAGVWAAHVMFDMPVWQFSQHAREGVAQWWSEVVATFGLVTVILYGAKHRPEAIPASVACYITAAYWFTASTSFANPAVTLARSLTNTFSGIRPVDVGGFVAAQCLGALLAYGAFRWMVREPQGSKGS
jgi:glycerol uptake facilitator-like aquaporin